MPCATVGQESSAPTELRDEDLASGRPVGFAPGGPFGGRSWEKQDAGAARLGLPRGHQMSCWSGWPPTSPRSPTSPPPEPGTAPPTRRCSPPTARRSSALVRPASSAPAKSQAGRQRELLELTARMPGGPWPPRCSARGRRPHQSRDRRTALRVAPHGEHPSTPGLRKARGHLPRRPHASCDRAQHGLRGAALVYSAGVAALAATASSFLVGRARVRANRRQRSRQLSSTEIACDR
jgi:hypothetical protein